MIHTFVFTQVDVLEAQFAALLSKISSTHDFEHIRQAHDKYIATLQAQLLLANNAVSPSPFNVVSRSPFNTLPLCLPTTHLSVVDLGGGRGEEGGGEIGGTYECNYLCHLIHFGGCVSNTWDIDHWCVLHRFPRC